MEVFALLKKQAKPCFDDAHLCAVLFFSGSIGRYLLRTQQLHKCCSPINNAR